METGAIRMSSRRHGFTLVELLVVIAIIGILVALLLPAIQAARDAARRAQCSNNLKQIGIAVLNFENSKKKLPAGSTTKGTAIKGPYWSTWAVDLLPYIEEQSLYDRWNQKVELDAAGNKDIQQGQVAAYVCPVDIETSVLEIPDSGLARDNSTFYRPGSYRANSGTATGSACNGYWDSPSGVGGLAQNTRGPVHTIDITGKLKPVKFGQITDGTSKTRLAGEYMTRTHRYEPPNTFSRRTFWSYAYTSYNQSSGIPESRLLYADYDRCVNFPGGSACPDDNCKRAWGSFHNGGLFQNVFCDGAVRAISEDVDIEVFRAACTIQGQETREPL